MSENTPQFHLNPSIEGLGISATVAIRLPSRSTSQRRKRNFQTWFR
ncbi:MAG: hypothetical protein U5K00_03700 [Melioribacteraceae bacterium]|nr:hypothetical protein [Melioribacteraceae bacterium]